MLTAVRPDGTTVRVLPGSLLWRKDLHLGAVEHYGVLVQEFPMPAVAHVDKSAEGFLRPKVEAFETFAAGLPVTAEPLPDPIPLEIMWQRVQEVATTRRPYGLMTFGEAWNCESFANFVRSGAPHSKQAISGKEALAILALVVGLGVILSGAVEG